MKSQVSIVRCPDYEPEAVETAVRQACDAARFPDAAGKTVLLKPNILRGAEPDKAVSTHPRCFAPPSATRSPEGPSRVLVGDSPAFQVGVAAFRKSGLLEASVEEGAEWVDFSDAVQVDNPEGRLVKSFTVARAAVEADILVSLCKLKNHTLMYYTGAMKNLFGCIPGLQKPQFHMRFPERARFGQMLTDLNLALKCEFSLMDAVVGMEGPGPSSGQPRGIGAILASRDPLALDCVACGIVGLDPRQVPNLEDALGRDAWVASVNDIEVLGAGPDEIRIEGWKHIPRGGRGLPRIPPALQNLIVGRPFFSKRACIACGACVTICPGKALALVPDAQAKAQRRIKVDYEKCIRCYCCHEVCPEDAILVRRMRPFGFA